MQELIPINVVIGDRSYRVKIDRGDEETVRKNLRSIHEKILEYRTHFAGKDMQDYIAMVLLWYATQPPPGDSGSLNPAIPDLLARMEQQLDKSL